MPGIRVRQFGNERARQRHAARAAQAAADRALIDEYERDYLTRERAAAYLGISIHTLRRQITAGTSPAYIKHGAAAQATVRFPRSELDDYLADPAGYMATRNERMAALAAAAAADE
jgi:excisionase family DNA binding protein